MKELYILFIKMKKYYKKKNINNNNKIISVKAKYNNEIFLTDKNINENIKNSFCNNIFNKRVSPMKNNGFYIFLSKQSIELPDNKSTKIVRKFNLNEESKKDKSERNEKNIDEIILNKGNNIMNKVSKIKIIHENQKKKYMMKNNKLNKKNIINNNNTNNNSINGLQQKLMEIFNKKLKKYKNNNRNNSYNLSLSKTSNTSRLRTKNKAFIINTIQNTILHSKSKRNHSINIKSDKNIHINSNNERKNSISKYNKKNCDNTNYVYHKRVKSQINTNITNINNIDNDKSENTKKNLKNYYTINKPILTISPSLKKRNIFGFKTMSKLTEANKSKKIYKRNNEYNINHNYASHNNSLKNKNNIKKHMTITNTSIFSYKSNNNNKNKIIFSKNSDLKYKK